MRLVHEVKSISKLIFILLLLVSFILGALLSYIWTMGFYAPQEFHLPTQANATIERVEFYAQSATFFNVTILTPSYSRSPVRIQQILTSTDDGELHMATDTVPPLPYDLAPGSSQTFKAYWNWGNYTGQNVNVFAVVEEGSGPSGRGTTPFMNLTIASVIFDPSVSATNFTVTVQSMGSQTFMNITRITLNGESLVASPPLPHTLDGDASETFTLTKAWTDMQSENATVSVETLQGFTAHKREAVPEVLRVSSVFDAINTTSFHVTVQNVATPQISLNITKIRVDVLGETAIIEGASVIPQLPHVLQPGPEVFVCSWNWSSYLGKGAKAIVTVYTQEGFSRSSEVSIP